MEEFSVVVVDEDYKMGMETTSLETSEEGDLLLDATLQSEASTSSNNSLRLAPKKADPIYFACHKCLRAFVDADILRVHLRELHGIIFTERREHSGSNSFLTVGTKSLKLNLGVNLGERHLSVLTSKIHGRGLFSGNYIAKGEMVIEYTGDVISKACALRRQHMYDTKHVDHYIMKVGKVIIDATIEGSCAKFINNSCDPNCFAEQIEIQGRNRVFIFTSRNILAGEELTYDYQFTSDELIPCNCGAAKCRRFLNYNMDKLNMNEECVESLIKSLV